MYNNNLEMAYTINVLSRLVESADRYIDDGVWIDHLTDDLKSAKALIKGYKKLIKARNKNYD